MYKCHIDEILIAPNRQRREFDPQQLATLSESIQRLGLMHPPVVRRTPEGPQLIAGERRLRAMRMLVELEVPIVYGSTAFTGGMIPLTLIEEMDELSAFEAELEENIQRTDLTWQERAEATAKLHDLRSRQASGRGAVHTLADTARELLPLTEGIGSRHSSVRDDVRIAQHLNLPEVAKAPSRREALRVIEKKERAQHRARLAEQFDLSATPHTLVHGSAFDELPKLAPGSIDLLLTDPPYGMAADSFGSNFSTTHDYEDNWEYFLEISRTLADESARVLKPSAHAYVFCSVEGWLVLKADFERVGFKVWPWPMIWNKGNGNAPWINAGHKHTYECVMFASRGDRQCNTVRPDVLNIAPVGEREHGATKPVELYTDLIDRSSQPGDVILDPFVGSGTLFRACSKTSCIGIGFEREFDSYTLALEALK
jgi:site-specific DNA-methyltransferase (adenine-specific)